MERRQAPMQPLTAQMRALVSSILVAVVPWVIVLGLFPSHTSFHWMWPMDDPRSAVLVGAVYAGAAVSYVAALRLNDWRQTKIGLQGTFVVSAVLLTAVAIDWPTVRPYHAMTLLWLLAYYGPLFLIPILFRREERLGDPRENDAEPALSSWWRYWLVLRGAFYFGLTVTGFVFAQAIAARWPWPIDALEVRMFMAQPATFAWAAVDLARGAHGWRRYRLYFLYMAVLGVVQWLGLGLLRTPYDWGAPLGVALAVLFAEWIVTPALLLLVYEPARQGRTHPSGPQPQEAGPGRGPSVTYGAQLVGGAYLAIGILGFIPLEEVNPYRPDGVGAVYLLRHIAVNGLHNIVHIVIGLTGLLAAQRADLIRLWGWTVGVVLLLLSLAGLAQAVLEGFPRDQALLGLVPLNSAGHTFHVATGVISLLLAHWGRRAAREDMAG